MKNVKYFYNTERSKPVDHGTKIENHDLLISSVQKSVVHYLTRYER